MRLPRLPRLPTVTVSSSLLNWGFSRPGGSTVCIQTTVPIAGPLWRLGERLQCRRGNHAWVPTEPVDELLPELIQDSVHLECVRCSARTDSFEPYEYEEA